MAKKFEFATRTQATDVAARRARDEQTTYYVVERYVDFQRITADLVTLPPLPTNTVNFGWVSVADLPNVLRLDHPSTGMTLAVLRKAQPDGTVEAVTDPRSHEARLRQFCDLDAQALSDEIAMVMRLDIDDAIIAAEYDEDEAVRRFDAGLAEGEAEGQA